MKFTLADLKQAMVAQMAEADGRPLPGADDCQVCGALGPLEFKDSLSVKEHLISGMCQACQDETFTEEDE